MNSKCGIKCPKCRLIQRCERHHRLKTGVLQHCHFDLISWSFHYWNDRLEKEGIANGELLRVDEK